MAKVTKQVKDLNKQISFATGNALNDVVFDARRAEVAALPRYIDRPVKWIASGFHVERAPRHGTRAYLRIPRAQWDRVMKYQVVGGTNADRTHAVPVNAKLNRYGGLGRAGLRRELNAKGAFIATSGGVTGIWKQERSGPNRGRLRLQVVFKKSVSYRPIYPFGEAARRAVKANWNKHFARRLDSAIKTAR